MSVHADELLFECGLLGEPGAGALAEIVETLRSLGERPAPAPSPALAALMADPPQVRRRAHARVVAIGAAALAASTVAATGVAAAANELPVSAQQLVSDISARYLPFQFPAPIPAVGSLEDDVAPEDDSGSLTEDPGPGAQVVPVAPTPSETVAPVTTAPSGTPSPTASGAPSPTGSATASGTAGPGGSASPGATGGPSGSSSPSGGTKEPDPSTSADAGEGSGSDDGGGPRLEVPPTVDPSEVDDVISSPEPTTESDGSKPSDTA